MNEKGFKAAMALGVLAFLAGTRWLPILSSNHRGGEEHA
jgi:hypothetical protein